MALQVIPPSVALGTLETDESIVSVDRFLMAVSMALEPVSSAANTTGMRLSFVATLVLPQVRTLVK